ncbi:hypothetical protein ACYSNW_04810 [Enterococcus sp. LJL99]
MAKIVKLTQQKIDKESGMSYHSTENVPVDSSFDLFDDYYAYVIGKKKDTDGNQVYSGMIGKNKLVRFADVVDIEVIEEG